jgi:branched-chain amino acid transport system substrate-binding protein
VIDPGQPITIGLSAALSGDQLNLGTDIADAAELALMDAGASLRGFPVVIARQDDGCTDPEKAANVARSLVENSTLAGVIGPMCTTGAQAASSIYERAQIVHISPSATRIELSQQGEDFFFRTVWRDDVQAQEQADYARDAMNARTVVLIDDGDPYSTGLADAFEEEFEADGGEVLSRQRIKRGTVDFASLATAVVNLNPDLVVFEGLNPEGALVVQRLRADQYGGGFMGPDGLFSVRDYLLTAGPATEGSIISGGPMPDDAFNLRFQAQFQRLPSTPFVLQAYDAVRVLLLAIEAVAVTDPDGALVIEREALAHELRARAFLGLTGRIEFDEVGDRRGESARELGLVLYRVAGAQFVPVE